MLKTVDELKKQAEDHGITFYYVRACSMCGYPLGYLIDEDRVGFDSGCYCTGQGQNVGLRSWEDLTQSYNMNQPENNPDIGKQFLVELNDTWKFEDVENQLKDMK